MSLVKEWRTLDLVTDIILFSLANLTVPPTPSGFTGGVYVQTSKPLNPVAVYVVAIECMYQWAQDPWDSETDGGTAYEDGYNVIIVANTDFPVGPLQLKVSHVVLGLYEGLMEMLQQKKSCEVSVTLSLYQRQVGILSMKANNPSIGSNSSSEAGFVDIDAILPASRVNNSSNVLQGEYTDPTDAKLKMIYSYHGSRIPSKDIFTAALNGLVNAAVFDPTSPCQLLKAISESASCVIYIGTIAGQSMTYAQATKALKWMSSTIPIHERNFGEMNVQLMYDGQKIAEGYILKGIIPNSGSEGVATS